MPYSEHPVFSDPQQGVKLWRYMEMWKFRSLLKREELFFCRADVFSDPFEGASPEREVEHRIREQRNIASLPGFDIDEETIRGNVDDLNQLQKNLRKSVVINCWNADEHESAAMWRLYLKDKFGVAIQSTPARLKESFQRTDHEVHAGEVRYLDYEKDIYYDDQEFPYVGYNVLAPFVHKRKFFRYEHEYRALIDLSKLTTSPVYDWSGEESQKGKFVQVDLVRLIEKVVVPPQSEDRFVDEVREEVSEAGLNVDVRKSAMADEPRF
jgi:hypothetical protein